MPPTIHHVYLLALSSLLHFTSPVEARKGLGSAIGEAVGAVDLKLTGKERALFAIAITFGVLTLCQVLVAVLFLKPKSEKKKQPELQWDGRPRERGLYGGVVLAGTVWLTIYYALDATFYTRGSPSWDLFPSGVIPTRIFFFKSFVLISCVAVLLLIRYRWDSFKSNVTTTTTTASQSDASQRIRIVYTILPIIYLIAMLFLTIAEVALYSYYFSHKLVWVMPTWLLNGIRATSTLFAVAYVLLGITLIKSTGRLEKEIKQTKPDLQAQAQDAPSEPTAEEKQVSQRQVIYKPNTPLTRTPRIQQDDLDSTLFGPICHFLCTHAFITLIFNIVSYFPDSFYAFGCQLSQLLIYGFLHLFFYAFLVGFGEPPEQKDSKTQADTTRPQKPIPAWAKPE